MTRYGYARVSTKDQAEGFGISVQRERLLTNGVVRSRIFEDEGISGTIMDRPALGALILMLEPGDELVVPRLDRFARDLIVQEVLLVELRRKGAELVSCEPGENAYLADDDGADPSRKLIRQILGAVAEYERSMIALRTQAGKRAKKAAGGYAGGQPPYGWRGVGGKLVEVYNEQLMIHLMRQRYASGEDFGQVAFFLNAQMWTRRNGKPWTRNAVRKVLLRQGTPAGAVGQDGSPVDAAQVDDQVVGADRDSGQDVGTDGSGPLGLG